MLNTKLDFWVECKKGVGRDRWTDGVYGIELELEGGPLPNQFPDAWAAVHDGSIKGIEYVLRKPLSRKDTESALDLLWASMRDAKTKLKPSNRCSTHVHINVQKMTQFDLFKFLTLYYVVEEVLLTYCGANRHGNLFCVGADEDEGQITRLRNMLIDGGGKYVAQYYGQEDRYAALNLVALKKFGSLEFRQFPMTEEPAKLLKWLDILDQLFKRASQYETPDMVLHDLSANGLDYFFDTTFAGTLSRNEIAGDTLEMLKDGMRRVQDMVYAVDWNEILRNKKEPKKPKPRGVLNLEGLTLEEIEDFREQLFRDFHDADGEIEEQARIVEDLAEIEEVLAGGGN